jgi:hypothetical protein
VNLYRATREPCDFGEDLKDLDKMAQLRSSFADVNCNLVPLIASIWLRVQLFSQSTYICPYRDWAEFY